MVCQIFHVHSTPALCVTCQKKFHVHYAARDQNSKISLGPRKVPEQILKSGSIWSRSFYDVFLISTILEGMWMGLYNTHLKYVTLKEKFSFISITESRPNIGQNSCFSHKTSYFTDNCHNETQWKSFTTCLICLRSAACKAEATIKRAPQSWFSKCSNHAYDDSFFLCL